MIDNPWCVGGIAIIIVRTSQIYVIFLGVVFSAGVVRVAGLEIILVNDELVLDMLRGYHGERK